MNALIWVITILTAIWLLTVLLVVAKNKELDKLSDKLCEKNRLCQALAEAIEQQIISLNQSEAAVKFYKDAYLASEEVRKKLVAERGGNE